MRWFKYSHCFYFISCVCLVYLRSLILIFIPIIAVAPSLTSTVPHCAIFISNYNNKQFLNISTCKCKFHQKDLENPENQHWISTALKLSNARVRSTDELFLSAMLLSSHRFRYKEISQLLNITHYIPPNIIYPFTDNTDCIYIII